jgi:ankyrin repeat protein
MANVQDACRRNDTNFFWRFLQQIDRPISGTVPGRNTYAIVTAGQYHAYNTIHFLYNNGVVPNRTNSEGETVLITMMRSTQIVDTNELLYVINKGERVNYQDKNGYTALMHAAELQPASVNETLLNAGANLNMTNINGFSALYYASDEIKARLLLNRGAQTSLTNVNGETPLQHIKRANPELYHTLWGLK